MRIAAILTAALLFPSLAIAQVPASQAIPANQPIISDWARQQAVFARHAMVASQEALATRIGVDILKRGGNAVDAAVAVGFALAVTLPRAGNIGGGGFMLVYSKKDNKSIAIDYREVAPASATKTMFLDAKGDADPKKSRDSGLAVGVPGTVAGLAFAH
jgi:gamma-glutamyltranspeptidase / glutathione hydrolase